MPTTHTDIVIIGAGVIGNSIAYHLARQGQRVLVIEHDLFEDVRAEHDRPPVGAELVEQVHHVQPLPGVHPVERLVEQHHMLVVNELFIDLVQLLYALVVRGFS
jgi:choline dehydrogenase-like flavoprotein